MSLWGMCANHSTCICLLLYAHWVWHETVQHWVSPELTSADSEDVAAGSQKPGFVLVV